MDIGMLWWDDDKKRTLSEKVERAANYYHVKFGVRPTHCFVHPDLVEGDIAAGLKIRPDRMVIKNHFWLGVEEEENESR